MKRTAFSAWVVTLAIFLGAAFAVAAPEEKKPAAPASSASVTTPATPAPAGSAYVAPNYTSGVAPMPSGSAVPKSWLPPGADYPDPGPNHAIYPSQKITIRFNHKKHVVGQKLPCKNCHAAAEKSTQASDWLLPKKHDACIDCHTIDEQEPLKDQDPGDAPTRCDACHLGAQVGPGTKVAVQKLQIPTANLKMNHKVHLANGMKCEQCHGDVANLELATRDQLPRMKGCFTCHQQSSAGGLNKATANAKSECKTCHVTEKDGVLKTMFASGTLMPPKWLKNSQHGSDWIERHKKVAGADSAYCGNCHKESECADCHDGRTRPRSVHPNDWLNMHEISARFDAPKCQSCHSTTNFCVPCHTRVGIGGTSGPTGIGAPRFHPPASTWSAPKRVPGHHSYEAQKNISACVSCHVERDCVVCHGTQGVGGAGANPHGPNFAGKCGTMYAKNPRPCFVCHEPGDSNIEKFCK